MTDVTEQTVMLSRFGDIQPWLAKGTRVLPGPGGWAVAVQHLGFVKYLSQVQR
jgi:hypothetical protein